MKRPLLINVTTTIYFITEHYNLSKSDGKRTKTLTNVSKQMNTWTANHNYIFRKYFHSL